ncbi:MAG: putative Ig domain-containing protein [Nitrospirota bacterium]
MTSPAEKVSSQVQLQTGMAVIGLTSTNTPPAVEKAKLQLETSQIIDTVGVIASGSDKDNDAVSLQYEWTKNGEPAGAGETISGLKRGDKIFVKITPFDGKDYGHPKTLSVEIQNTPPKILQHVEAKFSGNVYSYQVKASDTDDDNLTYSLKSSPEGMTINPSTGLIQWSVPDDFNGKAPITVSVTDGHGGEATHSFNIEIRPD